MNTGLIPTLIGFGFMIILLLYYFLKPHKSIITSKIFRIILIIIFIALIAEIVSSYCFYNNNSLFLGYLFLRTHWFLALIWMITEFIYWICYIEDIKADTIMEVIKTNKKCKYFTNFSIIYIIVYMFIPFSNMTAETLSYVPGIALFYCLVHCIIMHSIVIYSMIKKWNKINKNVKNTFIIMFVVMGALIPFQFIFQNICFWGAIVTIVMYILYFLLEIKKEN